MFMTSFCMQQTGSSSQPITKVTPTFSHTRNGVRSREGTSNSFTSKIFCKNERPKFKCGCTKVSDPITLFWLAHVCCNVMYEQTKSVIGIIGLVLFFKFYPLALQMFWLTALADRDAFCGRMDCCSMVVCNTIKGKTRNNSYCYHGDQEKRSPHVK